MIYKKMSKTKQPYTIVFLGKTGSGKSTTLNELFGMNWKTDNAIACTKSPQEAFIKQHYKINLFHNILRIVDMPGIGESLEADNFYQLYYEEWISKTNSLVWVTQADTRAYKRDQVILTKLIPFFNQSIKFTLALNRIDDIFLNGSERAFDVKSKKPKKELITELPKKIDDVYSVFKQINGIEKYLKKEQIIPYSAIYNWGTSDLIKTIVRGENVV